MLFAFAAAALLCAVPPAGAQPQASLDPQSPATAPEVSPYRFARGDQLNLRFFYTPELNTIATVRPDGRIALPLIGEIVVEGKTSAELSSTIVGLLAGQVKRPDVSINVEGATSQRVFVGGEVMRPGVQPLVGPLSVVQAVMVAEGLRDTARANGVVLIRRGPKGERNVIPINLEAALDGQDLSQDMALQAYDVVVVPRSGIANVNLWIDQYLRRNLPIGISASYSYNQGGLQK